MDKKDEERLEKDVENEIEKPKKKSGIFVFKILSSNVKKIIISVAVVLVLVLVVTKIFKKKEPVKEVITVSTLEKIVEVSELSTFKVVYNGVALSEEKYYVSYEATVDAGIDFEKIEITVDNGAKIVTIKLPQAEILDTYVDIASLDYIFIDKKANTETVSDDAFKLCKYDVRYESNNQEAIIDIAQQNAENVVTALVKPFVDQVDPEYKIIVE